jgi:hypothetical protein
MPGVSGVAMIVTVLSPNTSWSPLSLTTGLLRSLSYTAVEAVLGRLGPERGVVLGLLHASVPW